MLDHFSLQALPHFLISLSKSAPTPDNILKLLKSGILAHSQSGSLQHAQKCIFFEFEKVSRS
jgi:hypothetical protein